MTVLTSYLLAFFSLFLVLDPASHNSGALAKQPDNWLILETLDLQLSGPFFDVAFYGDNIIYRNAGEEVLLSVPMLRPDPSNSRPLFSNGGISCSPAALSFSGDLSKGYYTQPVRGSEQIYMEKIFEMTIEEDRVSEPRQLSFSNDPSRNLHPAISSDGTLMVFSSDRTPTNGGLDLFVTRLNADGWSSPQNLGKSINTNGHEWFPYLDRNSNLWFSSSGHSAYGGFDIFLCPYQDGEWGLPQNLGASINTPQNEFGFSIHPQKQVALFSRVQHMEPKGRGLMINLNEEALNAAGMDQAIARDIIRVIQNMADPSSPEITVESPKTEEPTITETVVEKPAPVPVENPDQVVFRIQIISSLYENSFPTILIDGISHSTYEYFYLGSYRITVGEFTSLDDAKAFRIRCLDSGFKQAFVAAFRGGKRVTDPSVFK